MGTYASTSDVAARVPGRTIDGSSKPTLTQVSAWVDEAESRLTGALSAGQCATPVTNADGIKIMRSWACDYAEARVRMAWAAAGGDGNTDGVAALERFDNLINDIVDRPAVYDAMLNAGGASDSTRRVRSHILDNSDELTVDDGDFDPVFEMSEEF